MTPRLSLILCSLAVGLLSLAASPVHAQNQSDGSIYSRFGIGERQHFYSPQSQAMGGGGIALSSLRYVNTSNPASWYDQHFVRAGGSMTFEQLTERADGFRDSELGSGRFTAVQIGLPLRSRKTGIALSFAPYTRVNYRVDAQESLDPGDGTAPVPFTQSFRGNGGLQNLSIGLGQKLSPHFSVGASVSFLFGILEESQSSEFGSIDFADRTIISGTRLDGVTGTVAARYTTGDFIGTGDAFSIAATFTLPTTLDAERVVTLGRGEDADTLRSGITGSMDLPLGFGVGAAWQPDPKWIVIADIRYEEWASFESQLGLPGYEPGQEAQLEDRIRISGGVEYWPGSQRAFAGFFTRMAYRFGLYADNDYISPDQAESINSVGVTGGLSIPSLIPGTTIDLNVDVGRRGTTDQGLIQDRYIRVGLNLNYGERWFDRLPFG